jgi:hypothetical protein
MLLFCLGITFNAILKVTAIVRTFKTKKRIEWDSIVMNSFIGLIGVAGVFGIIISTFGMITVLGVLTEKCQDREGNTGIQCEYYFEGIRYTTCTSSQTQYDSLVNREVTVTINRFFPSVSEVDL